MTGTRHFTHARYIEMTTVKTQMQLKLKCSEDRKESSVSFVFWQGHHNHVLLLSSLLSPFTKQTTILIHSLSWKL